MTLPFNSPQTESNPEADLEFLRQQMEAAKKEEQVTKKLATHIAKIWQKNQQDFKPTRLDMVSTLRRVRGEYEPAKLAAIRAFRGTEAYVRSGENKCRAAESWIKDIYRGDVDIPWSIEPTAESELPDETIEEIQMKCQQEAMTLQQELIASGAMVNPDEVADLLNQYYNEQLDKAKEALQKEAKKRCERAAKLIRDQNQEANWNNTFKDFLYYFTRLKYGIIKGPILVKKNKQQWVADPASPSGFTLQTASVLQYDSYAVSPFSFFPQKGMKTINDGDVIELHELTKQALYDLIGVPGYSEEELRAVISKFEGGAIKSRWFTIDDETAVNQVTKEKIQTYQTNPPTQNTSDGSKDTVMAQEFWGTVSGKMLIEWGAEGELDPEMQYQANCWKIGDHVIKAVINPDPLGRKPYHISSWAKNPEWIIGEGLLEFAAPVEDAMNAVVRAMINNIAIASGPMCEIDKDRVDLKQPIYPWRQIESTSMQMKNNGPAVQYYQPQMHAQELSNAFLFFSKLLDELTVPAYAQGASQSGVTAGTATVFTQLLAAASRSIKAVVANIDDDIISPYIQMCYDFNMKFGEDSSMMGDARVVAKGINGLLAKEQAAQRKIEFLQVAMTPVLSQILGPKNLGSLAAQIAKSNDISLPDMERLDGDPSVAAVVEQMLLAQTGAIMDNNGANDPNQMNGQAAQGGRNQKKAQGMNPDGSKAGVAQ